MAKLKLLIEVDYGAETMHSGDKCKESKQWFMDHVLLGKGGKSEPLILHSNEIGDSIGEVKVLEVYPF